MSKNKIYTVYVHICKIPNENEVYKRYIGITCQKPENRWKNGNGYKKKNRKGKYNYFYKAILKYGWDNFEHKVLIHGLTKEQAERWETKLIKHYKSNNEKFGYNSTEGGETNIPNEETRNKIRIANTGKHLAKETKQKLSQIFKGCKNPKITESLKKYYKTHNGVMKGKNFSLETRQKMSMAKIGKPSSKVGIKLNNIQLDKLRRYGKNSTPVVCLETSQVFISQTQAGEKLNIPHKHICSVCKGKREHTFNFHFMYLEDFKQKCPELIDKLVYM